MRLGGYALDACGEDAELGPGRGPTAHDTCLWLRKLEGLADGSRELPPSSRPRSARSSGASSTPRAAPRSARSTTWPGSGPSPRGGRSSSTAPRCWSQLATALPMMAGGARAVLRAAEVLRTAVSSGRRRGRWGAAPPRRSPGAARPDTELAHALGGLSPALARSARAGRKPELEALCLELVLAATACTARPRRPGEGAARERAEGADDSPLAPTTENARASRRWWRAPSAPASSRCSTCGSRRSAPSRRRCSRPRSGAIRRTPPPPPRPRRSRTSSRATSS
jgi:hypothetical protein